MNPTQLENILAQFRNKIVAAGIHRQTIAINDINDALTVIEGIGKLRNPNFVIDSDNRWVYTQLIKWAIADPTMQAVDPDSNTQINGRLDRGIYISGPTGTGKSWALEVLRYFTDIDHIMVDIEGETVRLWWQNNRAEDIWDDSATRAEALSEYKKRRILCIQDLGSEPAGEAVRMGTRREPLRQILESRGDRTDCLTLITSNFNINHPEMQARYSDRVVSRLKEMCNFLPLTGKDRRKLRG